MKVKSLSRVRLLVTSWSPPGSSIHGIFQARVLEWGAIAFSDSCCQEPINIMKRQKHVRLEDGPLRSESVHYATGEEQRAITNSSRKNETAVPKDNNIKNATTKLKKCYSMEGKL